jgi:hypothetical protein
MVDERPNPQSENPRSEPEIIPPGMPLESRRMRDSAETHGTQRIYIARLGPFGIILLALVIGIVSVAILILLLGAFLLWIPVVGLIVAAAIFSGALRSYFRRAP